MFLFLWNILWSLTKLDLNYCFLFCNHFYFYGKSNSESLELTLNKSPVLQSCSHNDHWLMVMYYFPLLTGVETTEKLWNKKGKLTFYLSSSVHKRKVSYSRKKIRLNSILFKDNFLLFAGVEMIEKVWNKKWNRHFISVHKRKVTCSRKKNRSITYAIKNKEGSTATTRLWLSQSRKKATANSPVFPTAITDCGLCIWVTKRKCFI